MVVGGRLKAKYCLFKAVLYLECICLYEKPFKALSGVFEDQSLKERLTSGGAKEGVVSVLGRIRSMYCQVLERA